MMITDHLIAVYDRPVPRYTSYPTADRFADNVGAENAKHWLAERTRGAGGMVRGSSG